MDEVISRVYGVKWIKTISVHKSDNRNKEQILKECKELSDIREWVGELTKDDGRYCPICNVAADIQKDVECPICKGPTFRFGGFH